MSQVQNIPGIEYHPSTQHFEIRYLDPSRHSMEDVIKVIAITLETLLEDEENQIRYLLLLTWLLLDARGLACIVDASNLSLAHMTFWNPIELRRVINLCEKGIPMRHKGVNFIHLPPFVTCQFSFIKNFFLYFTFMTRSTTSTFPPLSPPCSNL